MTRRWEWTTLATGAAVLVCLSLAGPGTASAAIALGDVEADVESNATAAGVRDDDEKADAGFSTFNEATAASIGNADGSASAQSTQDTVISMSGGELSAIESEAQVDAEYNQDPGHQFSGFGDSELSVQFTVDSTVNYSLNGSIRAVGDLDDNNLSCTQVQVALTTAGANFFVASPQENPFCGLGAGEPDELSFATSGTLAPGVYEIVARIDPARATSLERASGSAAGDYDFRLGLDADACTMFAQAGEATLGTPDDDVICGTSGDDNGLVGGGGDDRIFGFGGADFINGGADDDVIDAGEGDEIFVYGGPGDDEIDAGPGDDGEALTNNVVAGGPGSDVIEGGPGDDQLYGRCGEAINEIPSPICPSDPPTPGEDDFDEIDGGPGNDNLLGDLESGPIRGGDGNDFAVAAEGGSTILLGKGNDQATGSEFRDEIDGGPGDDGLLTDLGLFGGGGPDTITGGPGDDLLDGADGNDDLFGEAGSDKLRGDDNNDCLVGGTSKDDLEAGKGDDTIIAKDGGRDTGSGGPGPDEGRFDRADNIASVAARNFQGGC